MKRLIDRILFWFYDQEQFHKLVERFSPWGEMLTRLMLEKYTGKRMEFINISLKTQKYYTLSGKSSNYTHYYGGNLMYDGLWDLDYFNQLSPNEQIHFVWDKGCEYLICASEASKNLPLADACRYAYAKGLEMGLNPDFRRLSVPIELYGKNLLACIWIRYDISTMLMTAVFTLEAEDQVLFEKKICAVEFKFDFFPGWFKKIEVKNGDTIIVKGHYELDCLPMKIPISEEVVKRGRQG